MLFGEESNNNNKNNKNNHASQFDDFIFNNIISCGGTMRSCIHKNQQQQRHHHHRIQFQDNFSVKVEDGDDSSNNNNLADWWLEPYADLELLFLDQEERDKDNERKNHIIIRRVDFYNCHLERLPISLQCLDQELQVLKLHNLEYLTQLDLLLTTNLSNLQELEIHGCDSLQLSSSSLPKSLITLRIHSCCNIFVNCGSWTAAPTTIAPPFGHLVETSSTATTTTTTTTTAAAADLEIISKNNSHSKCFIPSQSSSSIIELPPNLQSLVITGSELDMTLLTSKVLWGRHSNLQSLRLSMCDLDEHDLAILLRTIIVILPTCPCLTKLDVSGNRIASLDNIIISKHHQNGQQQQQPTSSSRLRSMNLEGNPIVNSTDPHEKNALARILKVHHPELCCIGNNNSNSNNGGKASKWPLLAGTLRLEHALDANYARVLLQQPGRWNMMPQEVPLSLWPLVISNINGQLKKEEERRVTMIYDVLQGPALAGRSPVTY